MGDRIELLMRTVAPISIWLVFVFGASNAIAAVSCRDIASVDFRNQVIRARSDSGKPYYGVFNGPGPGGPLRLRDGVFLQWDLTPGMWAMLSPDEREETNGKPDWKTTIQQDITLHPTPTMDVRLLVLDQVHLTGTGSFTYIFGFQCAAGSLTKVFEASAEGIRFERTTENGMDISVAIWNKDDAHCCPRREVHLRYRWSPSLKRFVRDSSNAACPWLP
jgi:hypothetical protein